jgi:diaminopimelate epimerase
MSGAGNTFIMLDGRELMLGVDLEALALWICSAEHPHGGADGMIAVDPWDAGDFVMHYYNRDGSTGMMCGNGGRCAVAFAGYHGMIRDRDQISFINAGIVYTAALTDRGVKVWFPDPNGFRLDLDLDVEGTAEHCHFADVGTPHVVLFVDEATRPELGSLATIDLDRWGPPLRRHAAFLPSGANANFVEVLPDGAGIGLRTFERGVEGETGACGTGAISSAIIASKLRGLTPPVAVRVASGDTLWIDFRMDGESVTDLSLEGSADVVMEGAIDTTSL